MPWRIRILKLFFVSFAVALLLRLGHWQVVYGQSLKLEAQNQHTARILLPSQRGEILTADSKPLASNLLNYLLFITPKNFSADRSQINQLSAIVGSTESATLLDHIGDSSASWLPISRSITEIQKTKIDNLNLQGLGFEPHPERFYPEGTSSAHLLGFTGRDDTGSPKGYFGLEGYYDRQLSGVPGWHILEHDALFNPILIGRSNRIPPIIGRTLKTSLSRELQFLIYSKLAKSIETYQAEGGTVTVMEPSTGRILAMVSLPGYDPARYSDYSSASFKNPVVSDSYEPGSTFKVLIMASALDANAITPSTRCTICNRSVVVTDHAIKTYNDQYHPDSTMSEIIQNSDNVGMVFVGRQLGDSQLVNYLHKFHIGRRTGIDLEDEATPLLRADSAWQPLDYAAATFGQGIAVTPLQLVRAVGAIANRGDMVTPRLVDQIISPTDSKEPNVPEPTRVVSAQAALQTTEMMVDAVKYNKVGWVVPGGIKIAGKTGTAQIPIAGNYDENKTIGSFVGFAPAYNPKFVMLVTINESKKSPWGSRTAAPLWFDIAHDIIRIYNIRP